MTQAAGPSPRLQQALDTLRDFEKRYPAATELHLLAGALRLAAASGLGRYDDAARGVANLPTSPPNPGYADLLEKIAHSFLRTSADIAPTDPRCRTEMGEPRGGHLRSAERTGAPDTG